VRGVLVWSKEDVGSSATASDTQGRFGPVLLAGSKNSKICLLLQLMLTQAWLPFLDLTGARHVDSNRLRDLLLLTSLPFIVELATSSS
jgi:hypothetical protein